ncbi:Rieske 2Fe-2S domain-containing protein [Dermatobacter hominis]|uniref:Rieske 2Fe-2S domain-containing protein n=1 Tax=Dermatobacter hominis TaxID=2884263 RepID=UPI0035AB81B3
MLIADALDDRDHEWAPPFDPRRHLPRPGTVAGLVRDNLSVAGHLIGDKVGSLDPPTVDDLAAGDGGIVDVDGVKAAAFRQDDGTLVLRSATCTHLGCQVAWNGEASTWDCPCHGSRFDREGSVLAGPATRPLGPLADGGPGVPGS